MLDFPLSVDALQADPTEENRFPGLPVAPTGFLVVASPCLRADGIGDRLINPVQSIGLRQRGPVGPE